jgi:hypothetical protein
VGLSKETQVSTNLTIEAPNFEKIAKEAGQFTSDAINLLWAALNDTRKVERMDFRLVKDILAPRVLTISPSASVDNLDLQGCSVVSFTGASSVNLTGFRAPETGQSRVLFLEVSGAGTITAKHNVTSEAANRLVLDGAGDVTLATNAGIILVYLASRWREVARSG